MTLLRLNRFPFLGERDHGRDLGTAVRAREFLPKVRGRGIGIMTGHRAFGGQSKIACNSPKSSHLESEGKAASGNFRFSFSFI